MNSKTIADVFSILKYILLITLTVELISAVMIYTTIDGSNFETQGEQIFFSVFHAVSAFCNAGFSTLTNNLFEDGFKYNYYLQLVIIFTLVFGGLGFPIVVNIMKYFKYKVVQLFSFSKRKKLQGLGNQYQQQDHAGNNIFSYRGRIYRILHTRMEPYPCRPQWIRKNCHSFIRCNNPENLQALTRSI
ncbi:MAG: potassium transporter TrkG [Flavobacteriaceae bacterium]|nr:potassium transporter TrkG [Flavobacteriaceae bacterium]